MKRLVVLAGLLRGGEYTWNSIYSNLQQPLNADLAIATSKENVINTTLYEKSKYKFFSMSMMIGSNIMKKTFREIGKHISTKDNKQVYLLQAIYISPSKT